MVFSCIGSVNADACPNRVHAGLPAVCHNLRYCMRNESLAHLMLVTSSDAAFLIRIPLNSLFLPCVCYVIVKPSAHGRTWPQAISMAMIRCSLFGRSSSIFCASPRCYKRNTSTCKNQCDKQVEHRHEANLQDHVEAVQAAAVEANLLTEFTKPETLFESTTSLERSR